MYPIKKILVCLDLSEIDDVLVQYASMMNAILEADTIYLMHVSKSEEIPDSISKQYPGLLPKPNLTTMKKIKQSLESNFASSTKTKVDIVLEVGIASQKIIAFVKEKDIDLLIVGRKLALTGTGIIPQKLLRLAPCNVLFIPEKNPGDIKKIMVPLDFSEQSAKALYRAINFLQDKNIEILFNNVYTVPSGYHTTGKSYEDFAEIMKSHAAKDCEEFLKQFPLEKIKYNCVYTLDNDKRPADKIYSVAMAQHVDLIFIGSKGRTSAASLLLGSVTEQLANYNSEIPLFVAKGKEEVMGFLDAILRL